MQQDLSTNLSYKSATNCPRVFKDHPFLYVLNDNTTLMAASLECFTALMTVLTFMTCQWSVEVLLSTQHTQRTECWKREVKDPHFKVFRYLASTGAFFSQESKGDFLLKLPLGAYIHHQVPTPYCGLWLAHGVATSVWEKRVWMFLSPSLTSQHP